MTKRDYNKMSRKEVREEYLDKVYGTHVHQGFLAGIKYELGAIYHSTITALKNLADDAKHSSTDEKGNYHKFGTVKRYERDKATERIEERTARNREHILRGRGLETSLAILGFIGGTFFLTKNITGNAISNFSESTSSLIGVSLFILSLLGCFALIRIKKESKL